MFIDLNCFLRWAMWPMGLLFKRFLKALLYYTLLISQKLSLYWKISESIALLHNVNISEIIALLKDFWKHCFIERTALNTGVWQEIIWTWVLFSSWPGDEIEPADGDPSEVYRILFDITFFFFVIVILLAIIQGNHRYMTDI